MRLKLKIGVLSLTLLISLILYSCVDEPYIEPVKRPFSEIRVLNLSHNVPNMRVVIDGAQPVASLNSMAIPSTTDYFDVQSGERLFQIYNEAGDLIYQKEIEITSYERMHVLFVGEYDSDPLISTFSELRVFEGYNYVDHSPDPGTTDITLVHAAAPYGIVSEREYTRITATVPKQDGTTKDTTFIQIGDNTFAYTEVLVYDSLFAGQYDFHFTTGTGATSNTVDYTTSFTSDKRAFIYLYGRPDAVEFFSYEITPPPARQRN